MRHHSGAYFALSEFGTIVSAVAHDPFLDTAIELAPKSLGEGGMPIGAVLLHKAPNRVKTINEGR